MKIIVAAILLCVLLSGCSATQTKTITIAQTTQTAYLTTITQNGGTATITRNETQTVTLPAVTSTITEPAVTITHATQLPPQTITAPPVTLIAPTTITAVTTIYATPQNSLHLTGVTAFSGLSAPGGGSVTASPIYLSIAYTNSAPTAFSGVYVNFTFTTNLSNVAVSSLDGTAWTITNNGNLSYTAKSAPLTFGVSGGVVFKMTTTDTLSSSLFVINMSAVMV